MTLAVIDGLITLTTLSLVFVPVVYEIVEAVEDWIALRTARLIAAL